MAVEALRQGAIVAVKGIGGFHLIVDARSRRAVARLRKRKLRSEKPFAVMYPTLNLIKDEFEVNVLEEQLLVSAAAPNGGNASASVASLLS